MAERETANPGSQVFTQKLKTPRQSFQQCIDGFIESHRDGWKNPKHRAQVRSTLETYGTSLLNLNIASIATPLVLEVLMRIWKTKTETASRVQGRIANVIDWATARGYRTGDNPARWVGHLDQLLAKQDRT